jgi:hypothetical protein
VRSIRKQTASLGHRGGRDILPRGLRRLSRYRRYCPALCHHFPSSASCCASMVFSADSAPRAAHARACRCLCVRDRACLSAALLKYFSPNSARCVGQRFLRDFTSAKLLCIAKEA